MIFFSFEYFFKGWIVVNHKLFNCPTSISNVYEPPVINFLIPIYDRGIVIPRVPTLYFVTYIIFFSNK